MKTLKLNIDEQTLSHELRIPLAGILGMADLLGLENLTSEQQQEVEVIKEAGQRLLAFVDELLANNTHARYLKAQLAAKRINH